MPSRSASSDGTARSAPAAERPAYPFAALVGQEEMKLALLLNAIDPTIGGVLIMGHRGTGKSTAVRALADLLPQLKRVRDCLYGCDPLDRSALCHDCRQRLGAGERLASVSASVPVVDLPLGATEDRVCGTINLERALKDGIKVFEPGLLARAHRGFLYIDEVNLLEDHLVDLLLDTAVTGRNTVEREGVSIEHPARFVLIGSGNPEEGELRPQLLDRFGLHAEVRTESDLDRRVQIVLAREAFDRDPQAFIAAVEPEQSRLRRRLIKARRVLHQVIVAHDTLRRIAALSLRLELHGHRGELTVTRAARALAALEGRRAVSDTDVRRVALMALRHRLRRDPLEETSGGARIEQALDQFFPHPPQPQDSPRDPEDDDGQPRSQNQRRSHEQRGHNEPRRGREQSEAGPENQNSNGSSASSAAHAREKGASPQNGSSRAPNAERKHPVEQQRPIPAAEQGHLPDAAAPPEGARAQSRTRKNLVPSARRGAQGRSGYNTRRGRYARASATKTDGARIALDATLRANASGRIANEAQPSNDEGRPAPALRYKLLKRKLGTLFIFAIDTSGSMALNRIGQARGALAGLLRQSYIRRDRVALVSFRQRCAEVLLPPSASVTRAARLLEELCIGGPTPLAAGILSALDLARRAQRQQGPGRVVLLLFTDGHANVTLSGEVLRASKERDSLIWSELERVGAELQRASVASIVVDTHNSFTSGGEGKLLADKLGGRHVFLPPNAVAASRELDALNDRIKNGR